MQYTKKTTTAGNSTSNRVIYPGDKWAALTVLTGIAAILIYFVHSKSTKFDHLRDQMRFFVPPALRLAITISLFFLACLSFVKYHHCVKEQNRNNFRT